ncbi:hypothetical protein KEM52_004259 [Ascosphaera acerosa]|nr:hypothetical protein KEM52_004259 [Ascosphaera acerosa]
MATALRFLPPSFGWSSWCWCCVCFFGLVLVVFVFVFFSRLDTLGASGSGAARYVASGWVDSYRALMTSFNVLAVFAVACLWSDVVLLMARARGVRSERGARARARARAEDEEAEAAARHGRDARAERQQGSEWLVHSSDALRTWMA